MLDCMRGGGGAMERLSVCVDDGEMMGSEMRTLHSLVLVRLFNGCQM